MEFYDQVAGILLGPGLGWFVAGSVVLVLGLAYTGAPLVLWTIALAIILVGFGAMPITLAVFLGLAVIFNIKLIRRFLVSAVIMKMIKKVLPKISETERVALEAGVVWVEKDLFSGKPDFKKILREPYPELTSEEKAFLDGPVERVCEACDDWKVYQDRELSPEVWEILKKEKFFGMIIPKEFGGLGFSGLAHSAVIQKLATRCVPLCVTAMVPNSLGPAELLVHYGTEEQKKHYLPRLANGEDIPCFALTEPMAGSDAGSLTSSGTLFKGDDGKLYLKLNWDKRWITLAAISTVLGLAFRLYDPENLLGKGKDLGITCALIPSKTKGVILGRRHDPLGVPFYNCPTQGKDVVVPVDAIIGGTEWAGRGWQMLMESLAAGRGISLPAQSAGGAKMAYAVAGSHAAIRKQFGVPIGHFEGVEEPLARIGAYNYLLEAMRRYTCGAIDQGIKPPVITAMAKYNATELARQVCTDAMDILGGQGISRGPRNLMAHTYMAGPIGITVEGANIMTRTLIIFGQGALRAHPYAFKEVDSVGKNDLKGFDAAFWGHVGHVIRNGTRAVLLSLTRGCLASAPVRGPVATYYRKLAWISASFAILSDLAMGLLGGSLKFREKITGRFADILSWMYLSTCILRRFEAEGRRKEDLPYVHYGLQQGLAKIQRAFDGIYENFGTPLGWFFSHVVRPWSHVNALEDEPSDKTGHKIAKLIQQDNERRLEMVEGIFIPQKEGESLKRILDTFKVVKAAEAIEKKVRMAVKKKKIPKVKGAKLIEEAVKAGIITLAESENLKKAEKMRVDAITVDDFSQEEYLGHSSGIVETVKHALKM